MVEEDPTKPVTYKKVTQSAHTGYKTELYKVVYENDIEVSRTLVNKSYYAPAPRYITIGTKKVDETPEPEGADNADDDVDEQDNKSDATQDDTDVSDEQYEDDIYWDPEWDEEGPEDE